MAERKQFQGSVPVGNVPTALYSTAVAASLNDLADTFQRVAIGAQNRADTIAIGEARQAGRLAGGEGKPPKADNSTLVGQAYNEAAADTFINRLDLQSRQKLDELRGKYPADPEGFKAASDGYMAGVLGEANDVVPWAVPIMRAKYNFEAQSALREIGANFHKVETDKAKASVFALTDQIHRDIDNSAVNLFSSDTQQSTAWFAKASMEWSRIQGMYAQRDANGLPLFSQEDQAKARVAFWDRVYMSGLKSWVDQQPDKNKALADIQSGKVQARVAEIDANGDATGTVFVVDPKRDMTRPEYDKLTQYAQTQASHYMAELNRQEALNQKAKTQAEEANFKAGIDLMFTGKLSPDWVRAHRGGLSPSGYEALTQAAVGGGGKVDNPNVILELEADSKAGGDITDKLNTAFANREITQSTFQSYTQRNAARMGKDAPASDYRQMEDLYDGFAGKGMIMTQFDPFILQIQGMKSEFNRWWVDFPKATDPKTGQPINRQPTFEEAKAFMVRQMRGTLDTEKLNRFEAGVFGIKLPPTLPIVRTPDGKMDTASMAKSAFESYAVVDPKTKVSSNPVKRDDPATWPDSLKRTLRALRQYDEQSKRLDEMMTNLDAIGR